MRFFTSLLVLISFGLQSQSVYMNPISLDLDQDYKKLIKKYETFYLNTADIQTALNKQSGNIYKLILRSPNTSMELELFEYDLKRPDYVVRTSEGVQPKRTDFRWFKGTVNNDNHSTVCLTVANDFFKLFVITDGETYFLEQLSKSNTSNNYRSKDQFIFYKESDFVPVKGLTCGATDLRKGIEERKMQDENLSEEHIHSRNTNCVVIDISLAADVTMYGKQGSVAATEDAMLATLAGVQSVFDNEFEYEYLYQAGQVFIATDPIMDPWWNVNDPFAHLTVFESVANQIFPNQDYDVATAWTAKYTSGVIGVAYLRAVCQLNRFNICSDFLPGQSNGRGYLQLQAHELGHNFSCVHDGAPAPTIMAPSFNGSVLWSGQSVAYLNDFVRTQQLVGGCLFACPGSEAPIPDFSADPIYGCAPVTVQFNDLSQFTTSWKWSFAGGIPATSTLQNPIVVYNSPGSFDVQLETANSRCKTSLNKPAFIEINDKPTSNFIVFVDNTVTPPVVYFTNLSLRGDTYLWKFGDGQTSDEFEPIHEYARDTSYDVELTVTNDCGTKVFKKRILVNSIPFADFTSDTIRGCAPKLIKFFDMSSSNVIRWTWKFPGGTPDFSLDKNPVIRYDRPGVYDVTLKVDAKQFSSGETKKLYVRIDSLPDGDISHVINGSTVDFTSNSRYALSHQWIFGDGNTSNLASPTHNYADGRYDVIYIATNECGDDTSRTIVSIGARPVAGFKVNNPSGCIPFVVQFENTSTVAAKSFRWYFPGGNPSTSTDENPIITYNNTGKYNVSLVAYNTQYSDSVGYSEFITINEKPTAEFSNTITGFKSFFSDLSKSVGTYFWEFGDGATSTEASPVHDYGREGEFKVRLIVQSQCGLDTFEKDIAVYLIPKVNFTSDVLKICEGQVVNFKDLSSLDVIEWAWQFDGGTPSISALKNPTIKFNKQGKYTIKLTVRNTNGTNSLTKTQNIEVYSNVLCPEKTKDHKVFLTDEVTEHPVEENDVQNRKRDGITPFAIYPNPANQYISLVIPDLVNDKAEIEIYTLAGRRMIFQVTQDVFTKINVSDLSAATYYVRVKNKQLNHVQKLVISQ